MDFSRYIEGEEPFTV